MTLKTFALGKKPPYTGKIKTTNWEKIVLDTKEEGLIPLKKGNSVKPRRKRPETREENRQKIQIIHWNRTKQPSAHEEILDFTPNQRHANVHDSDILFLIYHEQNSQTWTTSTQQGCGDAGSPTGGLWDNEIRYLLILCPRNPTSRQWWP